MKKNISSGIIPFASGTEVMMDTDEYGDPRFPIFIGFGSNGYLNHFSEDMTIDLKETQVGSKSFAFQMPSDGIITSIAIDYTNSFEIDYEKNEMVITAQIYYSDNSDNIFVPLKGAVLKLPIVTGLLKDSEYISKNKSNLSIDVSKGTRLMMVLYINNLRQKSIFTSGYVGGGIKIK